MKQILFIRGGEAFDRQEDYHAYLRNRKFNPFVEKKSWRDWIAWALSNEYEVIEPVMPCKQNADYLSWKIWFERYFDFLNDDETILIGNSLGSTFLLKWLSENTFPQRVSQLHLVCPVLSSEGLVGEGIGTFQADVTLFSTIASCVDHIYIYHSKDDPVVPYTHAEKIAGYLPSATFLTFQNRGHFSQPALPELLDNIGYYHT